MQICMEQIGENTILMRFHAIVRDIPSSGEPENILTKNYRGFSNYWKLSAKFLFSDIKVIDMVGFLSFF